MIEVRTEVYGERELATSLDAMPETLRDRLRALFPQAGEEIRAAASSLAPRSPRRSSTSKKYGPLRNRIKARFSEKGDSFIESVSPGRAFYGGFQETGLDTMRKPARKRGIVGVKLRRLKSGGVSVSARRGLVRGKGGLPTPFHLPAAPFMGPAFAARRDAIIDRIREAVVGATE